MKEWEKELIIQGYWRPLRLGRPHDELEIGCLAYADDLALLTDNKTTAIRQIEVLKRVLRKSTATDLLPKDRLILHEIRHTDFKHEIWQDQQIHTL